MLFFNNAIVRTPAKSVVNGIDDYANSGKPDYTKAVQEHESYVKLLTEMGIKVTILDPLVDYPDSCFVEDPAVVADKFAVITNPTRSSRTKEREKIRPIINKFYQKDQIFEIHRPGYLEGGDVMRVGNTFFVGLSARTNQVGINQFTKIAGKFDYEVISVPVNEFLHLKTGTTYLENNKLLVAGEYINNPYFKNFEQLQVPSEENYAVNCIDTGNGVIMPAGFPKVKTILIQHGFSPYEINMSEFSKIDGGLTCLSLRFNA
ncbi:dimethylarginine dimethylaminohydrolase family protein [Liquorilactobacillus sicerae]|uniref:dimethylarginine dimethylaminohydrolase family protein n=1 Tax=Liquorilactobacillus sicerae TaxID=1416943 RepID=UPI002480435B|nr:arginine deiminase family protein [Liquorilactobacillus sicerae]